MIRTVVADDQDLVRDGLRMILEASGDISVVAEAADGRRAIDLVAQLQPDVVLMDIRMPLLDGIEATRRIASAGSTSRVLILTTFDLDEYVYRAMRAGASGFLIKTVSGADLVHAVRAVHVGDTLLAPTVTRRLIEQYVRLPPPGRDRPPELDQLTARELDVLRLIAQGLSNLEIAAKLFVTEATVKTHVNRLLTKLHLRDRVQAVVYCYESGLIRAGQR